MPGTVSNGRVGRRRFPSVVSMTMLVESLRLGGGELVELSRQVAFADSLYARSTIFEASCPCT